MVCLFTHRVCSIPWLTVSANNLHEHGSTTSRTSFRTLQYYPTVYSVISHSRLHLSVFDPRFEYWRTKRSNEASWIFIFCLAFHETPKHHLLCSTGLPFVASPSKSAPSRTGQMELPTAKLTTGLQLGGPAQASFLCLRKLRK